MCADDAPKVRRSSSARAGENLGSRGGRGRISRMGGVYPPPRDHPHAAIRPISDRLKAPPSSAPTAPRSAQPPSRHRPQSPAGLSKPSVARSLRESVDYLPSGSATVLAPRMTSHPIVSKPPHSVLHSLPSPSRPLSPKLSQRPASPLPSHSASRPIPLPALPTNPRQFPGISIQFSAFSRPLLFPIPGLFDPASCPETRISPSRAEGARRAFPNFSDPVLDCRKRTRRVQSVPCRAKILPSEPFSVQELPWPTTFPGKTAR